MTTNLKVGDRVRRVNDTEVGTVSMLDGNEVLVDFDRRKIIMQIYLPAQSLKRVEEWEESEDRIHRYWVGIDA